MNNNWDEIAPISFLLPRNDTRAARALRRVYLHDKLLENNKESEKNLGLLYQDGIESYQVHK